VAQRKEILRRHENGEKTSHIAICQMHIRYGLRMMADRAASSNAQQEEDEEVEILP
jgi:hypothetical protein